MTGDELKAFILARKDNILKSKLPKKGKLANAILGKNNLIKVAFDIRTFPIVLSLAPTATEINSHDKDKSASSEINMH